MSIKPPYCKRHGHVIRGCGETPLRSAVDSALVEILTGEMTTFGLRHTLRSQNSSRRRRSHEDSKCGSNGSSLCNMVLSYHLPLPRPAPPPGLSVLSTPSPSPVFPLPYDNQNGVSIPSRLTSAEHRALVKPIGRKKAEDIPMMGLKGQVLSFSGHTHMSHY